MTNALTEALDLMATGRSELLKTYIEKNSDRYRYSFQYHSSPTSLEIAGSLMDHQWLDTQLIDASNRFERQEISILGLDLFVQTIQKFSVLHSEKILFDGYNSILKSKISGLKVLLAGSDSMNKKMRAIEFDYYRDKVLFEREMNKYLQEVDQNE